MSEENPAREEIIRAICESDGDAAEAADIIIATAVSPHNRLLEGLQQAAAIARGEHVPGSRTRHFRVSDGKATETLSPADIKLIVGLLDGWSDGPYRDGEVERIKRVLETTFTES